MRRLPVAALVLVQIGLALALVVVAWSAHSDGVHRDTQIASLRAQLAETRQQLAGERVAAQRREALLNARVLSLEQALRDQGIDPSTVGLRATPSATPQPSTVPVPRTSTAAATPPRTRPQSTPSHRASSAPRPTRTASPTPSPTPSPTCLRLPLLGACLQ